MITREQLADLHPGDVVELRDEAMWPGVVIRGPVAEHGLLSISLGPVRLDTRGTWEQRTLTVVSRAPRPLYVNHDRSEPVPGDVVRDEDTGDVYVREHNTAARPGPFWWCPVQGRSRRDDCINLPLLLLVDGETGRVVQ